MTALLIILCVLIGLGAAALLLIQRFENMPSKKKKKLFTKTINEVYTWFEDHGLMRRNPPYIRDYHREYPELKVLEDNHAVVQRECLELLNMKDRLTDVRALGAGYTEGGIHTAKWKAFMFKSGDFLEENCKLAPQTAELIRQASPAFTPRSFRCSIRIRKSPRTGVTTKGFLRYHLGVRIPYNNENKQCWLRVNGDRAQNALLDKEPDRQRRALLLEKRRRDHLRRQLPARCRQRIRRGARRVVARPAPQDAVLHHAAQPAVPVAGVP